eukprot:scaffold2.g7462.t1
MKASGRKEQAGGGASQPGAGRLAARAAPTATMQHQPPPVVRIPGPLLARLRSQVTVSSLSQVVGELVANAVDADATEVHVRLDCTPSCLRVSVADNGTGVPTASMPLLGTRSATSKLAGARAAAGDAPSAPATLGFRGEALAAICETAVVEVASRARGSFETHSALLRGGALLKAGLALEQRVRQGTVVTASDLFFNQPVKRKALLGAGLRKEVDRCREAVERLALIRPHVTFTLYDCSKRAFLLRLLRGRPLEQSAAQALGQPSADTLALVSPTPGAAIAVSGYATLPPHGAPNTGRQHIYVNGHCVRAAPICRMVDVLFQQLYRPNARLAWAEGGNGCGGELQAVRQAGNRHAAFLLQLSCAGAGCAVSFDADKMAVQFGDWPAALAAVRRAVLAAWRAVLTVGLLRELEGMEGSMACEQDVAAGGQATQQQGPEALPFQLWLQREAAGGSLDALLQQQAQDCAGAPGSDANEAEADGHSGERGSGRQRGSGGSRAGRLMLAGAKHALQLASRPLRFAHVGAQGQAVQEGQREEGRKRVRIANTPLVVQLPPEQEQADNNVDLPNGLPACEFQREAWKIQQEQQSEEGSLFEEQQQQLDEGSLWGGGSPALGGMSADSVERLIAGWRPQAVHRAQLMEAVPAGAAAAGVAADLGQREELQRLLRFSDGSSMDLELGEAELFGEGPWGEAAGQTPLPCQLQQQEQEQQQQLSLEERLLLEQAAKRQRAGARQRSRPQSAPPHARQCKRAVHTNPLGSLQAAGPGAAAREGMRGIDTISGLGWRQQKLAEQAPRDKGRRSGLVRRGLQQDTSPLVSLPRTVSAAAPRAASPAPMPAPAPPAFLQPDAGLDTLLCSWRNPVMVSPAAAGEAVLSLEEVAHACFARLVPTALSQEELQAAVALRQVDRKFVPVVCGSLLAIVDQHAADERVQLERLRAQLLEEGGRERHVSSMLLRAPQPLQLSEAEVQLLEAFGDRAEQWGWRWARASGDGARTGGGAPRHTLTHAPLLFGAAALSSADLKLYLHHLHDTCGAAGLPAGVVRVLNSRACRGAIMFGQELLSAQCQRLVGALGATQLCFSCAHGRPTTAPLADLTLLRRALGLRRAAAGGGGLSSGGRRMRVGLAGLRAKLECDVGAVQ